MNSTTQPNLANRARELLLGYPDETVESAVRFFETRDPSTLDRMLAGVLAFNLPAGGDAPHRDLTAMPGSSRLVEDLSLDSLTLTETAFILEDLLATKVPEDDLRSVVTWDDLRQLVRRRAGVA